VQKRCFDALAVKMASKKKKEREESALKRLLRRSKSFGSTRLFVGVRRDP